MRSFKRNLLNPPAEIIDEFSFFFFLSAVHRCDVDTKWRERVHVFLFGRHVIGMDLTI